MIGGDMVTVGKKFLLVAAVNVLLSLIIAVISWKSLDKLDPSKSTLMDYVLATQLQGTADMMHDALRGDVLRALLISNDPKNESYGSIADVKADVKDHADTFNDSHNQIYQLAIDESALNDIKKLRPLVDRYVDTGNQIIAALSSGDAVSNEVMDLYKQFQTDFSALEDSMEAGTKSLEDGYMGEKDKSIQLSNNTSKVLLYGTSVMIIFALIFSFFMGQSVVKSLANASSKLRDSINHVQGESESMTTSSHHLSERSTQQAAAIEETSAAVSKILKNLVQSSKTVRQSLSVTEKLDEVTQYGNETMGKLAQAMESMNETTKQIQRVSNVMEEIGNKTSVVNDIVFKTQLLSFNASIEAARAGQHGRGFAVVAEEVGNLANVSGDSAREIQSYLHEGQKFVNEVAALIQQRVVEGHQVTKDVQMIFQKMVNFGQELKDGMQIMYESTREQETSLQQISISVGEINSTARKNQESAIQTSSQAIKLIKESEKLGAVSDGIVSLIDGSSKAA
jgi:methyl-accepting chemotaxis protein